MSDLVLMIAGQSNGLVMFDLPVAGCVPGEGTYIWQGVWRPMTPNDGAGVISIANDLRGSFDNVYVYNGCWRYGGSCIVPMAASPPTNHWQPGYLPLSNCEAQVAASGGPVPQVVIWIQGEQEVSWGALFPSFDMTSLYKFYLDQLRVYLLGHWNVSAQQCVWMVTPVGNRNVYDPLPVRTAQQQYASSTDGVFLGPRRDDLALSDDVHLTGPSCQTFGQRVAASMLAYMEQQIMTDPQDKAAIAKLQATLSNLQISVSALLEIAVSLQINVGGIQQTIGVMAGRINTLEPANTLEQLDPLGTLEAQPFSFDA